VLDADIQTVKSTFNHPACLSLTGVALNTAGFGEADCLIFGNEARGIPTHVSEQISAKAYTIPGCGQIDSLNLAATVNMCIYELMTRWDSGVESGPGCSS
jgi:TrmH family RNA methyltransferase